MPAEDQDLVDAVESAACASDMRLDREPDATGMYQGGEHYTCRTATDGWVNLVLFPSYNALRDAGMVLGTLMCMTDGTSLVGQRVAIHTDDDSVVDPLKDIGAVAMGCAAG